LEISTAETRQAGFTRQRPGPAHRPPLRNEIR
jgi:hypothetical protein